MKVVTEIPMKYVFVNKLLSSELTEYVVEVGKALLFDNNLFKQRRNALTETIKEDVNDCFGFKVSESNLLEAIQLLLPIPCPDSYDTTYLAGNYVVDSVEGSRIKIHNSDYGYEICVKAHKEQDENQKIWFCQSGISEALNLPEDITLIKRGVFFVNS